MVTLFAPYLGILITLHFTAAAFCTSCHFLIKIKAAAQRKKNKLIRWLNLHLWSAFIMFFRFSFYLWVSNRWGWMSPGFLLVFDISIWIIDIWQSLKAFQSHPFSTFFWYHQAIREYLFALTLPRKVGWWWPLARCDSDCSSQEAASLRVGGGPSTAHCGHTAHYYGHTSIQS